MSESESSVLPYRCDPEDLGRWLEARARGRSLGQIRALGFSAKSFEGTSATTAAFGFAQPGSGELAPRGHEYVLATETEQRKLVREAMWGFEPYGLLLEAILSRDVPTTATELSWVETWWATQKFGSSTSNRAEGATTFARFADFALLAAYIQGRRGHPTRLEWSNEAASLLGVGRRPRGRQEFRAGSETMAPPAEATATAAAPPAVSFAEPPAAGVNTSHLTVEFGAGRVAHLTVPSALARAEKDRLLSLLDLLISVAPER